MIGAARFREYVERVRSASDILVVVQNHLSLNGSGKALCPFHEEGTPSFSVNLKGQYFHCFGCGTGGDVFRFIELIDRVPFVEAVRVLAERAGISPWDQSPESRVQVEVERARRQILADAARYYQTRLTPKAREYVEAYRKLPHEIVDRFQIGWADGGLKDHLIATGYAVEQGVEVGVLRKHDDGRILDFLYRRIVIPVRWRGQVVQLTGRTLEGRTPKYLHLALPIEHHFNQEALAAASPFITEGPFDAMSLEACGFSAVAMLGTGRDLDPRSIAHAEKVYLCLDPDEAGRKRALELAAQIGLRARLVDLPDGQDVSEFFVGGTRAEFEQLVNEARDVIQHRIEQIPASTNKIALPDRLEPILAEIEKVELARAEGYLGIIKERFHLTTDDIRAYRRQLNSSRKAAERKHREDEDSAAQSAPCAVFAELIDIVLADGKPAFLVKDVCGVNVVSSWKQGDQNFFPPEPDQMPWMLPRDEEVLRHIDEDTDGRLFDDLVEYHRGISEMPTDAHYHLLATWDFHTYLLESVQYSPYIWLFGVPERGKSRTGKGMVYVARRAIHVESVRDAYLIRVSENLQATVFFDVMDLWRKAERTGSEDILLQRFERGTKVPRVLYPDRGPHRDTVYYSVFGPTIIGTNESIHHILETRALLIPLPEATRTFDKDVTPEVGRPFRERLVAFRARHLGQPLPDADKPTPGRLGDMLRPLRQMVRLVKPESEPLLLELFEGLRKARSEAKSETLEGQILQVLRELESEVADEVLPVQRITEQLNIGRTDREKVTPQKIGRRLDALGFKKRRLPSNSRGLVWDKDLLRSTCEAYGLKETPETPETPGPLSPNDLKAGVSPGVSPGDSPEFQDGTTDSPEKLRDVTNCNKKISGVTGVSGVSAQVDGEDVCAQPESLETVDEEAFQERAAMLEFEAGLEREEAERRASDSGNGVG